MEFVIVYFVLLAVAFFFLIVRPRRRQLAARQQVAATLVPGDAIVTAGGIYGTVVSLEPTRIRLEIADGVVITIAREAVLGRPQPTAADDRGDGPDTPAVGEG